MLQKSGQIIADKFRLTRRIARGGMGAVWTARHLDLDVDVALKFLRPEESTGEGAESRFRKEARAAALIRSPHVVQILDFGLDDGVPYLAMELLPGEDLDDYLLRNGSLPLSQARTLVAQAARGIAAAHEQGVIHRDIKPSNLFLTEQGGEVVVKVLDFGIAKRTTQKDGETTTQGLVVGSPAYMSPEQARGNPVDQRSDLFSLAAVFYRAITGVSPFSGTSPSDIVVKLCTEEAPPPSTLAPHVDAEVDALLTRALAKNPALRFQSIKEFTDALSKLPDDAAPPLSPPQTHSKSSRGRDEATAPLSSAKDDVVAPLDRNRSPSLRIKGLLLLGGALILTLISYVALLSYADLRAPGSKDKDTAPQDPILPPEASRPRDASPQLRETGAEPRPVNTSEDKAKKSADAPVIAVEGPPTRPPRATPQKPVPTENQVPSEREITSAPRQETDPVFGLPLDPP